MTTTTEDDRPPLVLPDHGTGERARRRRGRSARLRAAGFGVTLAVLALSIPVLGVVGFGTVFDSRDGRTVSPRTDPAAAGYEAVVEPTPTLLIVQHDSRRDLAGMTLLSLSTGDRGGAVLFVPLTAAVDLGAFGTSTATTVYRGGGTDVLRVALGRTLGVGIDQAVDLDDAGWAALVRPVGTVTVDNPDAVVRAGGGKNGIVFPAGSVALEPDQVATYLALRSDGATEAARVGRQEFFWEAWFRAVGAAPTKAAPGESDTGIGRFVRTLAAGAVRYESLPVGDKGAVDRAAVAPLMADLVPLPVAADPGGRVRVKLLSGTEDHELSRSPIVAQVLVQAGAEISVVGNADRFTYGTTEVIYADAAKRDDAERLRDALGTGRVVEAKHGTDGIDVTVVLGTDARQVTRKGDSTG